jgi:hypothetical protein
MNKPPTWNHMKQILEDIFCKAEPQALSILAEEMNLVATCHLFPSLIAMHL